VLPLHYLWSCPPNGECITAITKEEDGNTYAHVDVDADETYETMYVPPQTHPRRATVTVNVNTNVTVPLQHHDHEHESFIYVSSEDLKGDIITVNG
jgi:hypothetical protein